MPGQVGECVVCMWSECQTESGLQERLWYFAAGEPRLRCRVVVAHTCQVWGVGCRLSERQTESGGLQGRPEKLQDVCYSWWALSSLTIMRKQHWINLEALTRFVLLSLIHI